MGQNLEHEDDGMMLNFKVIDPIGIQQISSEVPQKFELHQNYPNPFNPSTMIKFDISIAGNAELKVFDIQGREVAEIFNGNLMPGKYEANWNAEKFSSGTYIAKLTAGKFVKSIKLVLTK